MRNNHVEKKGQPVKPSGYKVRVHLLPYTGGRCSGCCDWLTDVSSAHPDTLAATPNPTALRPAGIGWDLPSLFLRCSCFDVEVVCVYVHPWESGL